MKPKKIGLMGAMPEETEGIVSLLKNKKETVLGGRTYFSGEINGIEAVVVFSRWGKVAAAVTAATLIQKFEVTQIIFTGVAGAVNADLKVGDIALARRLVQHDMDARPLMKQYELPLLGVTFLETAPEQLKRASAAVENLFNEEKLFSVFPARTLKEFNISAPKLVIGDIASGDQFFSGKKQKDALLSGLPGTLCVEMEGAAVAQACYENSVPFTVIRTISDAADESADIDFAMFIQKISNTYSREIIRNIFDLL